MLKKPNSSGLGMLFPFLPFFSVCIRYVGHVRIQFFPESPRSHSLLFQLNEHSFTWSPLCHFLCWSLDPLHRTLWFMFTCVYLGSQLDPKPTESRTCVLYLSYSPCSSKLISYYLQNAETLRRCDE